MRCEDIAADPDFRRLASLAGVAVDLRYAGPDNFVGRDVYGDLDCAWLHRLAAEGIERSVARLRADAPGCTLLVLDALRPHRVQVLLWEHLAGTPLQRYLADPARGSIHSYGLAVDVTLLDAAGRELDMGTGFDEMVALSHPQLEAEHVAAGLLTRQHLQNRRLLRAAMAAGGFNGIDSEWWHFDMLDRDHVRRHHRRIE